MLKEPKRKVIRMSEDKYTHKEDGSIETINGFTVAEWTKRQQANQEAAMYAHLYGGEDYRTVHKRQLLKSIPRLFRSNRNPLLPRRKVWPWVVLVAVSLAGGAVYVVGLTSILAWFV